MNHSNGSASPELGFNPHLLPADLTLFAVGLIVNSLVLVVLLTDREMQKNAFVTYLTNLTLANLYHILIGVPMKLVMFFYAGQPHTSLFCSLAIYARFTADALMMQCHVLISTNRIWAVLFPLGYRDWHNKKTAQRICALPWIYVNLFVVPGLMVDGQLHRTEKDNTVCTVYPHNRPQGMWILLMMLLFYVSPIFIILTSYPIIWYKRRDRSKRIEARSETDPEKVTENEPPRPAVLRAKNRSAGSRSFLVLSLLTGCVCLCWIPQLVEYGLMLLYHTRVPGFSAVADALFSSQPVLDPLLFGMALHIFRDKIELCKNVISKNHTFRKCFSFYSR